MKKGTKTIALGTVIAGAVGYLAGILTAPKSGAETREDIKSVTGNGMAEAEKQLKKLHTELTTLLDDASEEGKRLGKRLTDRGNDARDSDIVQKAQTVKQKTREIISAIHDGTADDRDLDKAISQATKAVKSIRSYLSK